MIRPSFYRELSSIEPVLMGALNLFRFIVDLQQARSRLSTCMYKLKNHYFAIKSGVLNLKKYACFIRFFFSFKIVQVIISRDGLLFARLQGI